MKTDRPVSGARRWPFSLSLEERAGVTEPLFRRISRAIAAEIQRGRLRPGMKLPGTRTLARTLHVHRNTVLAAYEELAGEGWTEPARASGTFVSRSLPDMKPKPFARRTTSRDTTPGRLGFDLGPDPVPLPAAQPTGAVFMSLGVPDVRLAPTTQLARAYRRVIRSAPAELLSYGHPHGHPRLREALAGMLSTTRGLASAWRHVMVTSGSQMALELVSRALIRPGDAVAIEEIGYRQAWKAFQHYGARLLPIPVDAAGLDVEALAEQARRTPLRAVYVTPHHQYPTTATLSAGRRLALLDLAKQLKFAVIEDDYDHEYHYDGRPVLPLASADQAGVVIYIGTLAKILAPGVRLGYVVAPEALVDRLAAHRSVIDRQGDHLVECAVADMLEHGEVQRHARKTRRIYASRRDCLARTLRRELGAELSFNVPPGGINLWATTAPGIDVDKWAARALEHGVVLYTGKYYSFDGRSRPHVRFGYAALEPHEMEEAVRRLKSAL
jgi:GntR family transcriptional regulator/MocR family aminotransferase